MERQFSRNELSEILTNQKRPSKKLSFAFNETVYVRRDDTESGAYSGAYVRGLRARLDSAGNDVQEICHAFASISGSYNTDRVRFELARVQVLLLCVSSFELGFSRIRSEKFKVKVADGRSFEVGSEQCPKHVFRSTPSKEDHRRGREVLSFYPVALAEQLGFEITRTWTEDDSIVDWIADFAQTEGLRAKPRLSVEKTEHDCIYKLWHNTADIPHTKHSAAVNRTEQQTLTEPLIPRNQADLLPKEKIYNFIVNAGKAIKSRTIIEQNFTSERHTYRLLNDLLDEDRVEKIQGEGYVPRGSIDKTSE